jgi:CHAD domain-containing protein
MANLTTADAGRSRQSDGAGGDYLLPEGMTFASAGRELASRLSIRAGKTRSCDRAYYDTFDGLLHRAHLIAVWDDGQLALVERDSDRVLARVAVEKPGPRVFAADLPPGRLRDSVRGLIDVRALLPLTEIRVRERPLDVLDGQRKTVARIRLEAPTVGRKRLATRVALRAVRGYAEAEQRVSETLETVLRFPRAEQRLVDEALAASGAKSGGTPSSVRVELEPGERADRAAAAVLRALLAVVEANLEGTIADIDSEFLHDLRVSVRRSRAVQRELRGALGGPELEHFRVELRWLQQVTGDARDLDVYVLEFDDMRALVPEPVRDDLEPVVEVLRRQRAEAHRRTARALRSERARVLLRDWGSFLDRVEPLPLDERPDATIPIEAVAGGRIRKVYRRMVKMGRAIDENSLSTEYHELRKKGKELRYLLELFAAPLYPEEVVKPMIKSLKALQDVLGRHQDREIQVATLRSLAPEIVGGPGGPAALMAMGMLVERLAEEQQDARAEFAERFEAFASKPAQRLIEETFS